jgi:hypothetical protein
MQQLIPYIIYDPRSPQEDWLRLTGELRRQGVNAYHIVHPVEDSDSVVRSINLTHKTCVRWAQERNEPMACIMEQDVWFPAEDGYIHWLAQCPKLFDLYLACTYGPKHTALYGSGFEVTYAVGFHCYLIYKRFYDDFLSLSEEKHIDTAIEGVEGVYKVCYPFTALQHPGISANSRVWEDRNVNLKEEDVYGKFK